MTIGKDMEVGLAEVGSTVEMAEALRASGAVDDLLSSDRYRRGCPDR